MNRREILAYMAGIIDGEGSIMLWKNKNSKKRGQYNLRINVSSTDKCLIDWINTHFAGHCYMVNAPSRQNPNWKKQFLWQLPSPNLLTFMIELVPFLIIKKERFQIAIKFRETFEKWQRPLKQETLDLRESYYVQMKLLNSRGC